MSKSKRKAPPATPAASELRIVGGRYRGSKLAYHGNPVTRPMKHRVREAIFNLVGAEAEGRLVIDLFAGTGALGLEALSRGAESALFIERHIPTARVVRENISKLQLDEVSKLLEASAMVWSKRDLANVPIDKPWLVFVSPPYAFFVDRQAEMVELIAGIVRCAPPGSTIVVESDERFDFDLLPGKVKQDRHDEGWDVRQYSPAVVGVWRT